MKNKTRQLLEIAQQFCDENDKSTEFMIQYMQDVCKVSHDTVINYLSLPNPEINTLRTTVMKFIHFMTEWMEGEEE